MLFYFSLLFNTGRRPFTIHFLFGSSLSYDQDSVTRYLVMNNDQKTGHEHLKYGHEPLETGHENFLSDHQMFNYF
jgi:hypothetical protein